MKIITTTFQTLKEIATSVLTNRTNPDPICQRPPVSQGHAKYIKIIESLLMGYPIGMLLYRDISNDPEMQKVYPGFKYLVIDGGHRVRAIVKFLSGDLVVNGKTYNMMEDEGFDFSNISIPTQIVECSSDEAGDLFEKINESTHVSEMEKVMANEVSVACKEVRSRVKSYREYNNNPIHPLFETRTDRNGKLKPLYWDMEPNARRQWDEYVFIALLKATYGGNVNAGINTDMREFANNGVPTKSALTTVDRFLNDALEFQRLRGGRGFNTSDFAAFQLTWFGFYEMNPVFAIKDMELFKNAFSRAYTLLTSPNDATYDNEDILIKNTRYPIKDFIRRNCKNFANSEIQKICFEYILREMTKIGDYGVVQKDTKRSLTYTERMDLLALQGFRCAIDGESLGIDDAVFAHDLAWSQGGKTAFSNGAMIRTSYNRDMGTLTIEEYRKTLLDRAA